MRELRERRGDGIARDEGTARSVLYPLHGFLPGPNSEKPTARAREGAVDASVTPGACNAPEFSIRGRAPRPPRGTAVGNSACPDHSARTRTPVARVFAA